MAKRQLSAQSQLGVMPSSWKLVPVKSITSKIGSGATPRGGNTVYLQQRVSHALIRSQNVYDRHFDDENLAFISEDHALQLKSSSVRKGDVLLNITGDGVTFGRACLVPERILPACVNQHVSILRVDPIEADPGFLLTFLTHPQTKVYMESFNTGGSRRAITKGHIESFEIPLPSLPNQRKIAGILSAYDDLIENNLRRIKILEQMAQFLYREWFVHFRFSGHESARFIDSELGQIPEGWKVGRLDDVIYVQRGFDITKKEQRDGPYQVISSSGPSSFHAEYKVKGPGIVIGRKGALGTVHYSDVDFWPHDTTLWVKEFRCGSALHAFYLLRSLDLGRFDSGVAVPTLNRNNIHGLPTVVPPITLLQKFEEHAGAKHRLLKILHRRNDNLCRTRDLLLPKLLSGGQASFRPGNPAGHRATSDCHT